MLRPGRHERGGRAGLRSVLLRMPRIAASSAGPEEDAVLERLSLLDRRLPVWILAAMAVGLLASPDVPATA